MPCATIHLLTAGRALAGAGPSLPFPVDDPVCRAAFLHGALAPDMGFVPGADRFVSEVSHYVSTGDLARRLLARAGTVPEAAFAWGWVTHLLTDLELHPRVGHAVGERTTGDRSVRMNAAENLPAHVGTEVGLDLHFLLSDPGIPTPPRDAAFDRVTIDYLVGALRETYRIPWHPEALLDTHRRSVRLMARWPRALRILEWGRGIGSAPPGLVRRAVGRGVAAAGARFSRPEGAARGFFRPVPPPEWLVADVEALARTFPGRVRRLAEGGIEQLGNHNLETGAPEEAPLPHPDAERTARRVARLRRAGSGPGTGPLEGPA